MNALDATFAALADPTRRAILERLAKGEASVGELAAPFDMSLPAVSKHLKVLERARLIERRPSAQWRHCRLRPERLETVHAWISQYERFWTESLDRLEEHLAAPDPEPEEQEKDRSHDDAERDGR